ncbi:MAG: WXG100 family type VII secretion target [Micrococcales bacterium]|nr:WXG100 family type VII secretion target [Micrococcales bacterium]
MSQYQVDVAQLAQTATAVQQRSATIQGEVAAMQRQLAGLQAVWKGAASAAFAGVVVDWSATQQRVEQSLAQIAQAMYAASQAYDQTEQAASRLFARA